MADFGDIKRFLSILFVTMLTISSIITATVFAAVGFIQLLTWIP